MVLMKGLTCPLALGVNGPGRIWRRPAVERWRGRYLPHVVAAALYVGVLLAAAFKELQELGRKIFLRGWMLSVASTMNMKDCKVHLCHKRALLHAARLARICDQKLLRALLTARSRKHVHENGTVQIPAQVAINVCRNQIYLVP